MTNSTSTAAHNFKAGANQTVITPSESMLLVGTLNPSTGVNDDLYARVIVLDDSINRVVIVTLDLIGMSLALVDKIRKAIHCRTGIEHVMLCCSHTHSAPFTIPWSILGWEDFQSSGEIWSSILADKIVQLVAHTQDNLSEVLLSVGSENVQIGQNRRYPSSDGIKMQPYPAGNAVGWTDVLKIENLAGQPLAVLFAHAAHPVVIHSSSNLISADYPGYAVSSIQKQLGDKCIALFAQGCGGDVNAPWLGGYDIASKLGGDLGNAAIRAAQGSEYIDGRLDISTTGIWLPLEEMPTVGECEEMLLSARNDLAKAEASTTVSPGFLWELQDRILILDDLRKKALDGVITQLYFEITAFKIDRKWCLTAMTHEVFADYQLWADTASPFKHNMTIAYVNGCESYIPTDNDLLLGGYEAASCPHCSDIPASMAALKYPQRLALVPGAEKLIKNALIDIWK